MALFSQRNQLAPVRVEIQLNDLDDVTRTQLWNIFYGFIIAKDIEGRKERDYPAHVYNLWSDFLHKPLHAIPSEGFQLRNELVELFFKQEWYRIFDLIEYFFSQTINPALGSLLIERVNQVLDKEMCAYRFVNRQFIPITDEAEINTIETAINYAQDGARIHLKRALELLSDRQNPDYRNSIKESISAVEAICVEITGDSKATLGQALKDPKLKDVFHGGILNGFSNLYGFTSNAEGIRHALMDEPTLKQEDALYMLVSCSAFVNYLRSKL